MHVPQQLSPSSVADDAREEYGDRDADESIAATWAALDDLHTVFRDRPAGSLDFFTRTRVDVHRVGGRALTIGDEAKTRLPRTWCDACSLHMASPWSADLYTCDAATCMADEYTLLSIIISTRARNRA